MSLLPTAGRAQIDSSRAVFGDGAVADQQAHEVTLVGAELAPSAAAHEAARR